MVFPGDDASGLRTRLEPVGFREFGPSGDQARRVGSQSIASTPVLWPRAAISSHTTRNRVAPKVGPHRQAMAALIAEVLAIDVSRVSVKATTTEGLGFTGRGEGIAAQATATIGLPGRA